MADISNQQNLRSHHKSPFFGAENPLRSRPIRPSPNATHSFSPSFQISLVEFQRLNCCSTKQSITDSSNFIDVGIPAGEIASPPVIRSLTCASARVESPRLLKYTYARTSIVVRTSFPRSRGDRAIAERIYTESTGVHRLVFCSGASGHERVFLSLLLWLLLLLCLRNVQPTVKSLQ